MLILLAPSKTMTTENRLPGGMISTEPLFLSDATQIVDVVRKRQHIDKLMGVSQSLSERVKDTYMHWGERSVPAIYAYRGDVYRWFYAETLGSADLQWAHRHLIILSGLYGIVRPLDAISPYRLEMKTKLDIGAGKDLYDFWGKRLAKKLDVLDDEIICNLSSDEYARVITKYTNKRVITPAFLDEKTNGTVGTVPIYSKMMRGVMARWMIDNRIDTPEGLKNFSSQGYRYDAARSVVDAPAFYRTNPRPIRFN